MIKKLILGVLAIVSIPFISYSQQSFNNDNQTNVNEPLIIDPIGGMYQIPLYCGNAQALVAASRAKNEKMIFMGAIIPDFFTFMAINEETRTYTILVINKSNNFACNAATGSTFELFSTTDVEI